MTSMQMDRAINDGILIPWRKNEPEKAKIALQLLTVDKGGLTFQPKIGERENVAGIDFASMYPSLMIKRNISPETVLCSCCRNIAVPEAGYNICEKRRGLIPLTLEPLVERRKVYKQMTKSADERTRAIYGARRAAMKWMLVTCFGYMGFLSSGGLAKLRQEMTFHLVYMQMTKPSHIGVAGELLRKVTLSRKSLLHTRDNACALDLPFFPTCAFR